MAANAELSQVVGVVCKGCISAEHTWNNKGRVEIFSCTNSKRCSPNSPEDLRRIIGSSTICPLKRVS